MGIKFEFTTDFQLEILRYTVLDGNGFKALELYDDKYFTLTHHAVIAYTLKKYYKKNKNIPGRVILQEEIQDTFNHRDFVNNLTDDDRIEITDLVNVMYKGTVKDGDELLKKTERFAQYVDLKHEIESIDLLNYEIYDQFSRKVQKAISPRIEKIDERGSFLIRDLRHRQIQRKDSPPLVPLPYKGMNILTNAGGYVKHSIFVVLDAAKKWKTGVLVNIAKRYARNHNVYVVDLDNGKGEFMMRVEQSVSGYTKSEILSGDSEIEEDVRKKMKRLRKVGKSEIIVKQYPALITTAADIEKDIVDIYVEHGIKIGVLIIDYMGKMGSISGKEAVNERVSEAYIDIENLAKKLDIDHVWTANHVNKVGQTQRMKTRYEATDIAHALDISRHVQAIYGLNRTPEEEEAGYQRMEIVEQRDGKKGRIVFKVDRERQTLLELKKDELEGYYEQFPNPLSESTDEEVKNNSSFKGAKKQVEDEKRRKRKRNNIKSDLDNEA